jgi:glycosidase
VILVTDTSGTVIPSDTLTLRLPEEQIPQPSIRFAIDDDRIRIGAIPNDPQGGPVTLIWSNQSTNPLMLSGVDGSSAESLEVDIPGLSGDYAFRLEVTDQDGYSNATVQHFTILPDSTVLLPGPADVPLWVADASIYSMFLRAYTPEGTLSAAAAQLEHIRDMGFNVIWLLPVMDVEGVLDQNYNIGYNIIDFYHIEPVYGTEADFREFVERAHTLGLRVILDVTPNHTSRSHPIALDVRSMQKFSRYYDFYQHEIIPHNDNGLGQSLSTDGIVYYSGFSDAILNWNWSDAEARRTMLDAFSHWLREYDIDGFRLDVYWGPHRRYGRSSFDQPLRQTLRSVKSDIFILGETAGTGTGTEIQFADRGGGMDAGYDWILNGTLNPFPSIANLEGSLYNGGYRPGPNSYFMRFLENHDEYRVAFRYNSVEKTLPVSAAVFLATGIPMLYQGQEVGMGFGMSGSKEYLARSTVDWENGPAATLAPHYQKLAQIRRQFPAFRRQMEDGNGDNQINSSDPSMQPRLPASSGLIYAYGRPWPDQNGIVVTNFCAQAVTFDLDVNPDSWAEFSGGYDAGGVYYLNDLYNQTSQTIGGNDLGSLRLTLPAYGVAVYTLSLTQDWLDLPLLWVSVRQDEASLPRSSALLTNFPNPFNSTTTIPYKLSGRGEVRLDVLDVRGRTIRTLVHGLREAGRHVVFWDGLTDGRIPAPSGVYICRLRAEGISFIEKMILAR